MPDPSPPARVYGLAPPGTRSRFYDNDQDDPDAPRLLDSYWGPHHPGPLRPGDLVTYDNPDAPWLGGPDGQPMTVTEIIDFGGGHPPQAILSDGRHEMSADNLRIIHRGSR